MAYLETDSPITLGSNGNNGGFFGNGDGIWAILLFAMIFGWGNGNGGFGGGFGGYGNNFLYDVNANTNRGFDNLSLHTDIDSVHNAVTSGNGDIINAINGMNSNFNQCLTENKKPIKFFATNKIAVGTCV